MKSVNKSICLEKFDEALSAGTMIKRLGLYDELLYVSENMKRFIGYSTDELKNMHLNAYREIIHPDDFQHVKEQKEIYAKNNPEYYEMEFRFVRKDGSIFWAIEKATFTPDFMGQPAYIIVFFDNTVQKEYMASALKENEQLISIIAKHSNKFIVIYDFATDKIKALDNKINRLSNVFKILESPMDYLENNIVSPESIDEINNCYEAMKSGIEDTSVRFRIKNAYGKWAWIRGLISAVFGDDGKPKYSICSFEDVTDECEKELVFDRYQKIIQTSDDELVFYFDYNLSMDNLEESRINIETRGLYEEAQKGYMHCIRKIEKELVAQNDKQFFFETFEKSRLLTGFSMEFNLVK